ncbi:MAG TPA: hypothetical protein VLF69_00145, partial [Candidatus Saccharimonadales bacterium]|nr:hypothetical protein [Candidatus Saccharimonadales bacterium]
ALELIAQTLAQLPKAETFDYGGHELRLGDYGVCEQCTVPIAEAQAAENALRRLAGELEDDTVKEHVELASQLFHTEAEAATVRAELHNGHGTEAILNKLLAHQYERHIGDDYQHSHHGGTE